MLSTVFQSLIAPRYPRRYVGRHRARIAIRFIHAGYIQRRAEKTLVDVE